MDKATFLDFLDKYMMDALHGADLELFEEAVNSNSEYKNELDMQQKIQKGITLFNRQHLLEELNGIREEVRKEGNGKIVNIGSKKSIKTKKNKGNNQSSSSPQAKIRHFIPLAIAASIAFLVGFFLFNQPPSPELLFAETMEVQVRPQVGKLGAGTTKIKEVQIYYSVDKTYFTEDETVLKIYVQDKSWADEDLVVEKRGSNEVVVFKKGDTAPKIIVVVRKKE